MSKRIRIVKKKRGTFNRFESDRYYRISRSWRKTRGIDCPVRRKFRGYVRAPKAGYGSNKKTRHLLPNYKKKFVVHNMAELECLLMSKDKYCAEIASTTGAVLRIQLLKRAKEMGIDVTNQKSQKIVRLEKKVKKEKK